VAVAKAWRRFASVLLPMNAAVEILPSVLLWDDPIPAARSRSNGGIVLAELDRLRTAGVRFGTVLADAGYGASAEFGRGLEAREQRWAVGLLPNQPVYDVDVQLVPPIGGKQCLVPDKAPRCAEYVRVL
jgi:SRSO17 transposase